MRGGWQGDEDSQEWGVTGLKTRHDKD